jgi:hypothetical protein
LIVKLQTRLLYRRLVSATSMIATLEDRSYSINKLPLIQSSSCIESRKRRNRTNLQDLISSIVRFVDGVFSGFPTFAKEEQFPRMETIPNRSLLNRMWISGQCAQELRPICAASNCSCRLYATSCHRGSSSGSGITHITSSRFREAKNK